MGLSIKRICTVLLILFIVSGISCDVADKKDEGSEENGNNNDQGITSKWELWSGGVKLRGANIHQRRIYPELDGNEFLGTGPVGPRYDQNDFNRLAAWGANYVNISYPGIYTEKPPYQLDQAVLSHLKKLIDMIAQADMFAVISYRTGPGRSEFTFFWGEHGDWFDASYYNDQVWKNKNAQDAWLKMWQETASQFRDSKVVAGYGLMVENWLRELFLSFGRLICKHPFWLVEWLTVRLIGYRI